MADRVKPADKDAAERKEIIRTIKGPVVDRLRENIPALAAHGDLYGTVMATPDLLSACMQLVRTRRDLFQDLLVDEAGNPVTDDDAPLRCKRSINQIIAMVVRSGAKAYSDKRWGGDSAAATAAVNTQTRSLLEKLAGLVRGKWSSDADSSKGDSGKSELTQGDRFYFAIKDHLHYDWQVPLIPYFAELPVKLVAELGAGVTSLRTPEGISALADIGRVSMDQARKIVSSEMMREMLDTQPLAAKGVSFLGKERYEFLHSAVYEKMGTNFWEMCVDCERLEAMEVQNAKDLENMAPWLHMLSGEAVNQLIRALLPPHIPAFLEVATEKLGQDEFVKIFGPGGSKKLVKVFCDKVSKTPLDPADPIADLRKRLPDVFKAYQRSPSDFEKGL